MTKAKGRKTVTVVVMDLDNTLFDWVEMWYRSFTAMLSRLAEDSKVPQETLEREFQAVFQKHGTSEYAFAIQELPSLQQKFPNEDLPSKFDPAIHAYNKARKETLRLYPTVLETLRTLIARGCLIVGYTESMAFYTNYRIRALGLDGILNYLYSPEDHDLPGDLTPEQIRHYSPEHYRLHRTVHDHTPRGVLKPSPSVLLAILRDVGVDASESIYVGDNLLKDIGMAQAAGVTDVYAKYGAAQDRPEYELLRRVTHWSPETVKRERQTKESEVRPSYVLDKDLGQLLEMFNFERFIVPIKEADKDQKQALVEIWKKTIDVQQHFNDIELRIRNFALTLLAAILGAVGFALKEEMYVIAFQYRVPLAVFLLVAGLIAWLGFYFMDRHWYHRLLYGAVNHGREIEQRARIILPELGLTEAIGRASPIEIFGIKVRTRAKIDIFYGLVAFLLVILVVLFLFAGPRGPTSWPQASTVFPTPPTTTPLQQPDPGAFVTIRGLYSIHFDLDQYDIRLGETKILDVNAEWMKAKPNYLILIQGHADEGGTYEYNLVLGDRRAKAAMHYLVGCDVAANRMTTISHGEERPLCMEKTEECWTRNRRVEFLVMPRRD